MIEKVQNFVFKGMLLNTGLDDLGEAGILTKNIANPINAKASNISIEDFSSTIRLSAIKMAEVYTAFFCFENSVRELISERLKERVGVDWWTKCVSSPIKKEVERRKGKDKENKWHAPRATQEIAYTDFSDMANIICNNWPHFEDLFPSQDWVKNRIGDLGQSRNAIAHNNALEERDVQRIQMYLADWIKQTG